jgi:hypothetical protein
MKKINNVFAILLPIIVLSGCGSSDTSNPSPTPSATVTTLDTSVSLSLTATVSSVAPNGIAYFNASGGTSPYRFSIYSGGGTIDSTSGVFTASSSTGTSQVKVIDSEGSVAYASISINSDSGSLVVTPASYSLGYSAQVNLSASGGVSPYVFSMYSGGGSLSASSALSTTYSAP